MSMFEWLKKLAPPEPEAAPPPSEEATIERLRAIATDAIIEDVWEAMDHHVDSIRGEVETLVGDDLLGAYPRHAAIIWLAYQDGNNGRMMDDFLKSQIQESIEWAFPFYENNVLTGGALGALDGLPEDDREQMALSVFEHLKDVTARRYWLIMKVRTDAFVEAIAASLVNGYEPEDRPKMAGAFRQFGPEDIETLLRHHSLESGGADLFVEAIGATNSPAAREALEQAAADDRPLVRKQAMIGLARLDAS